MRLLAVQMNIVEGDEPANFERAELLIAKASPLGGDLVVLPELFHCGYDWDFVRNLTEVDSVGTIERLSRIACKHSVFLVGGSIAEAKGDERFNTTFVFAPDGAAVARYVKVHLFSPFNEDRYFTAGHETEVVLCDDTAVGLMICYDLRFPEHARRLALNGAQVLAVPSVWPLRRRHAWRTLAIARAIEQQAAVVAVNRSGTDGAGLDYGASLIVDPQGKVLAESPDSEECVLSAECDLFEISKARAQIATFADRRPDVYRLDWEIASEPTFDYP